MKATRIENCAVRIHRSCRSILFDTNRTTACHTDRSALPDAMALDLPIFEVFDMRAYVHLSPRYRKVSGRKDGSSAALF